MTDVVFPLPATALTDACCPSIKAFTTAACSTEGLRPFSARNLRDSASIFEFIEDNEIDSEEDVGLEERFLDETATEDEEIVSSSSSSSSMTDFVIREERDSIRSPPVRSIVSVFSHFFLEDAPPPDISPLLLSLWGEDGKKR